MHETRQLDGGSAAAPPPGCRTVLYNHARMKKLLSLVVLLLASLSLGAQEQDPFSAATFNGFRLRAVGPALMSGRVSHIAVHPGDKQTWYVGVASGGVWKTTNAGITWTPVFQNEGAYSVGAVVIDQKNPATIWVGSGEANNQRSVGYGDGIYRSDDAGRTWRNLGLKTSEHIGRIVIDPRDSNVVFAAAYGPLWTAGGDRGLYKTTDGGKTWTKVLEISEHTGVSDVAIDPNNPDVLLAVAHQRRRHTWTLIHGGPESGLHKSTDGGKTWRRIREGIPGGDIGRIVLSFSPAQKGLVYAKVEPATGGVAIFASLDSGDSWERRGNVQAQPMYYKNIHPDPKNAERLYVPSVQTQISDDGGRTFRNLGERTKHVDNHYIWIDPDNTDHLLEGCDGGLYETLGPRPAVAALHQPVGDAVLQRRRRQRLADLQHLRRHAGQQHARRPVAVARAAGLDQQRLVHRHRRRRLRRPRRSHRHQHRLRRVAVRRHRPARSPHQRARQHPAGGREGRAAAALQLGVAVHHQPAQPVAAVLRRQQAVPQRRSRQQLEGDQPRPDAPDRSQPAAGDGPGLAARGDRAAPVDRDLGQHLGARRVAQARRPALCRHRRWADPVQLRRRRDLAQEREPARAARLQDARRLRAAHLRRQERRERRLRHLREQQERRLQAVRLQERPTRARPGPTLPATCRPTARRCRSPRITSIRTCCSSAPSSGCSSRSTAARSGSACATTCRPSPCATWRSRNARTTWCSARSAAASTCSTTTRRCARSAPRCSSATRTSSRPRRRCSRCRRPAAPAARRASSCGWARTCPRAPCSPTG